MDQNTPMRRVRTGVKLVLMLLVALLALPTFSISEPGGSGKDSSNQLVRSLRDRIGNFNVEVRDINGTLKEQASSLPKEIQNSQFSSTIASIGDMIYEAQTQHTMARENLMTGVVQDIQTFGIDETNPNALRGNGGCTDREIETWLWEEPSDFGKDLEDFGRKIKFLITAFDVTEDKEIKIKPGLSVQVFPMIEDHRLFTSAMYASMETYTLSMDTRIGGIVGGSYGDPNTQETVACAGVFGWAPPGSNVNVTAIGLNGPFNGSDTADSNGMWNVQLEGLSSGYYEFMADDGSTQDVREQAFLKFEFKF